MIKKKIKAFVVSLLLLAVPSLAIVASSPVLAAPIDDACGGLNLANPSLGACDKATADSGFKSVIKTIINVLTIAVGAVSVVMIIIGGFRYVVSNGDSNAVSGAKNTILYAVVGLVVALSAQLIVAFVINKS
jgi:ABC-type Fe3+ transport system permease subunit